MERQVNAINSIVRVDVAVSGRPTYRYKNRKIASRPLKLVYGRSINNYFLLYGL